MRPNKSFASVASVAVLSLAAVFGCGSVTAQGDAGSTTGTAGASGGGGAAAGQTGAAGAAGQTGAAGAAGQTGAAGAAGTVGQGGNGGGAAGSGHAGAGGGQAGAGGSGGGGAVDAGTDAKPSACALPMTVDRSCTVDADCVAVTHTINCCGSAVWLGIRASEKARFATLETACDKTYPACGCAAGPPTTDDGSLVSFGGTAGVTCQSGTCKTFSKACGHPCDSGRACTTCMAPDASAMSFCSLRCMQDTACTEPKLTRCQVVFTTGVCVDPTMACGGF